MLLLVAGQSCDRPNPRRTSTEHVAQYEGGDSPSDQASQPVRDAETDRPASSASLARHLVAAKRSGRFAIVDWQGLRRWKPNCLARKECVVKMIDLAPCAAERIAHLTELDQPERLEGQTVSVRGPLLVNGDVTMTLVLCVAEECCNRAWSALILGANGGLRLRGPQCGGDESRLCCPLPAFGQQVVATGTLVRDSESLPSEKRWSLQKFELCLEASDGGRW